MPPRCVRAETSMRAPSMWHWRLPRTAPGIRTASARAPGRRGNARVYVDLASVLPLCARGRRALGRDQRSEGLAAWPSRLPTADGRVHIAERAIERARAASRRARAEDLAAPA